jgi:hypothetical protein
MANRASHIDGTTGAQKLGRGLFVIPSEVEESHRTLKQQ